MAFRSLYSVHCSLYTSSHKQQDDELKKLVEDVEEKFGRRGINSLLKIAQKKLRRGRDVHTPEHSK